MKRVVILIAWLAMAVRSEAQKEVFMKLPADQESFTIEQLRSLQFLDSRMSWPAYYEGIQRKLSQELPKLGFAETSPGYFSGFVAGKQRTFDVSTQYLMQYAWWHYFVIEDVPFPGKVLSVAFDGKTVNVVNCDRNKYPGEKFMTLDLSLIPGNEDLKGMGYKIPVVSDHCGQWIRNQNPFVPKGVSAQPGSNVYNYYTYNTFNNYDSTGKHPTLPVEGYDWWCKRTIYYGFAHYEKERSKFHHLMPLGTDSLVHRDTVCRFIGSPLSILLGAAIIGGGIYGYHEYQEDLRRRYVSHHEPDPKPDPGPDTTVHINGSPTGPKPAPGQGNKPGGLDVIDRGTQPVAAAQQRYSYLAAQSLDYQRRQIAAQKPQPQRPSLYCTVKVGLPLNDVLRGHFASAFSNTKLLGVGVGPIGMMQFKN